MSTPWRANHQQSGIVLDDLPAAVGRALGPTAWHRVEEQDVARFTAAVGAGPPAVGPDEVPPLLLLSLTNRFLPQLLEVGGASSGVNYGTGCVRFPDPVPIGACLRASAEILEVADVPGGVQATVRVTQAVEGRPAPACVVDTISRYLR